jgi:hypothetical protein
MNYFAYGSNMSQPRLAARVPSARAIGVYELRRHTLRFHKIGRDGSAKCDAFFTGGEGDRVQGVVYVLHRAEIAVLDEAEDLGRGYEKRPVRLWSASAGRIDAFAYFALQIDTALRPFTWYKQHVLAGARSAGLHPDYVRGIERVPETRDADPDRESRELSPYGIGTPVRTPQHGRRSAS